MIVLGYLVNRQSLLAVVLLDIFPRILHDPIALAREHLVRRFLGIVVPIEIPVIKHVEVLQLLAPQHRFVRLTAEHTQKFRPLNIWLIPTVQLRFRYSST